MIPKEQFEEEFIVPNLEKKEKVIRRVLAFLKKYSGSTLQEIAETFVGPEEWCEIHQALETLKARGEIKQEVLFDNGEGYIQFMYTIKEKELKD